MVFSPVYSFAVTLLVSLATAVERPLPNELCKPRPTVVATDHPAYRHYPFFVTLHRCAGSWLATSPAHQKCVANTTTDIEVPALNLATLSPSDSIKVIVKMKNHTSCKAECETKASDCKNWETYDSHLCSCTCPYNKAPVSCGPKKYWNRYTCNCECSDTPALCPARRSWSIDSCGCICDAKYAAQCASDNKVLDTRTCGCKEGIKGKSSKNSKCDAITTRSFWYYVVIGEFLALVFIFDIVLYFKKTGMIYASTRACAGKSYSSGSGRDDMTSFDNCCGCRTVTSSVQTLNAEGETIKQVKVSLWKDNEHREKDRERSLEPIHFV